MNNRNLFLIAGPCVIESYENAREIAATLKQLAAEMEIDFWFKASFDKANRTSVDSFRGPGLEEGLKILGQIKGELNLKVTTDIHEPYQAEKVAETVDMIQIPAFLCRQTDLLAEAAKTRKTVNIKKAQFLAPWDMENVIQKLTYYGNNDIMLCERGTSFGYNRLVVDMTSILEMKKFGYPVVFDATHSVQLPGGMGACTGGNREYIPYLAQAALATGADGIFMEIHPDPDIAKSDGPNTLRLSDAKEVLSKLLKVYQSVH